MKGSMIVFISRLALIMSVLSTCGGGFGDSSDESEAFSIVYDANGATSGTPPSDGTRYTDGQAAKILGNTGGLAKTGYSYAGWNTAKDGKGITYTQGQTMEMGGSSVRLYARWTTNPTFTVTYAANGATGGTPPVDTTNYETGQTLTVLENTGSLVRTGHGFAGWNTASDGSGTAYSPGQSFVMGSAAVTLHAFWLAAPAGTVAADNASFIRVQWNPVANAAGYYVERAKDSGGSPAAYTRIATVTGTSYDHAGAFAQSVNWYRVQAYASTSASGPYGTAASATKTGTVSFSEDWEDGVWNDTWIADPNTDPITVTATYAASGTRSLGIADDGDNWNYWDGLHYEFAGGVQPTYVKFSIRKDWDQSPRHRINLGGDTTASDGGAVYYTWGKELDSGTDMAVEGGGSVYATHDSFHLVEFRNIDFAAQNFDFYVDGVPVTTGVPFYHSVSSFTRLYISVGWYAENAYIDAIELRN